MFCKYSAMEILEKFDMVERNNYQSCEGCYFVFHNFDGDRFDVHRDFCLWPHCEDGDKFYIFKKKRENMSAGELMKKGRIINALEGCHMNIKTFCKKKERDTDA